ncbi:MAG: 3'(2'),5'-bisphosphate nucleotidase CysQ [Alphaproteobacteria bacterium]
MQHFDALKDSILQAGETILEIYGQDDFKAITQWKDDHSPLTLADKAANDIIVAKLKELFPQDAILSEEEDDNLERLNNPHCWILDPLDGTKEFIKRNGEFTINLALAIDGKAVWGMIYAPVLRTLYWAEAGQGAFKQIENGETASIKATQRLDNLRFVASRSHNHPDMDKILEKHHNKVEDILSMGSSLKGCLVAEGKADIYIRHNPTMEWDTAAMQIIAEEAGAIFKQLDHSDMRYNRCDSLNTKGFYILNKAENNFLFNF